ncbi:hypothetical protein ACFYO1_35995 [Nocardia sp. NPDC006044]|uniref:hypothetical protein n=1 Tax=Nocardia sp. NPDC006044 TaxID=3364306 RepID=UPI003678A2AE
MLDDGSAPESTLSDSCLLVPVVKGLITREVDPANRRAKIVTLTERGREVPQRLGTAMFTRSSVARLGPVEQRQLARLLTELTRAKAVEAEAGTD